MPKRLVWLLWLLAAPLVAQVRFDPVKDVEVRFEKGAVLVKVAEGAHLNAEFMKVALKAGQPGSVEAQVPATTEKDADGGGIWHGSVKIPLKGKDLKDPVTLVVTYQPCTEGANSICFPPKDRELSVKAADLMAAPKKAEDKKVETPKEAVQPVADAPKPAPITAPVIAPQTPIAPAPEQSLLWALLVAFGAGLGASLTPCVYPMIPITMAIVGAKGSGRLRGFLLSLSLVLGMAVTYTTLGVVMARLGAAAGSFAQKPAFLVPMAVFFAAFALSLFGAFEIRLPAGLQSKLQGEGPRKGFGGAFVMGLVLGPISAPCVGPIVLTILTSITQQGKVAAGALQLFVFSLGMGVLFMAVGTFSAALPKSGDWLTRFKQLMGLVVLGFAAWTLRYVLPEWANLAAWALVGFVGAGTLGAFEAAEGVLGGLRKSLGLLGVAAGLLLSLRAVESAFELKLLPAGGAAAQAKVADTLWMEQDFEGAQAKAKAEKKLLLVDVYADWCVACHELDRDTWPDPQVQAWIRQNAVALRLNTDAQRKDLQPRLGILSYPTIILFDAEGREVRRQGGFHSAAEMLAWLKQG